MSLLSMYPFLAIRPLIGLLRASPAGLGLVVAHGNVDVAALSVSLQFNPRRFGCEGADRLASAALNFY